MDKLLSLAVVVLPLVLSVVGVLISLEPPGQGHRWKWRVGLLVFGIAVSIVTYVQQQQQRQESARQRVTLEGMLTTAQEQQKSTQRKLDESLLEQRHETDLIHDLQTQAGAANKLLEIMKKSLPPKQRKEAENIQRRWVREAHETAGADDTAAINPPKASPKPKEDPKP